MIFGVIGLSTHIYNCVESSNGFRMNIYNNIQIWIGKKYLNILFPGIRPLNSIFILMTSGVLYIIGANWIFDNEQDAMEFAIHYGHHQIRVYQTYGEVDVLIGTIIVIPQ